MVWLTGGNGMLGREIAEKLSAAGISYITTDAELDITDSIAVELFFKRNRLRWVINCAAYTAVDSAEEDELNAFAVNSEGVKNIAVAAEGAGVKVIHFSTDYVYPGDSTGGYIESDRTAPSSVYGRSKLSGEDELIALHPGYFIFRISWLYGPHGKNFVNTMLNLFNEKSELNVVNDQSGSPTYTGELADFIAGLVKSDSDNFGVYNFSGEGRTDWHEFASEIYRLAVKYRLTERNVKINPVDSSKYPQRAKRPACSYMLKDKLVKTFGYRPRPWRETLEEYIKIFTKTIKHR